MPSKKPVCAPQEKKKRIKTAFLIVLLLLALLLLICGVLFLVTRFLPDRSTAQPNDIFFEEPDYEIDISQDPDYLVLDRRIWVDDGIISQPLGDIDSAGNLLYLFFERYFQALIEGDATALRKCYTEECVRVFKIPYRMPMQRVYDIRVLLLSSESKTDSDGIVYTEHICQFEYKILKNDGVFRSDLESGAVRPQILTIREYYDRVIIYDAVTNFRK